MFPIWLTKECLVDSYSTSKTSKTVQIKNSDSNW